MARSIAKDHGDKRRAILATAAKFFARNGFDRSSMNDLAKACGVSKALIYHYYDSKDALLYDIIDSHLGKVVSAVEDVAPQADAKAELRALVHAILTAYRHADAEHKVQLEALASLPVAQQKTLGDVQRRLVARVSAVVGRVAPESVADAPDRLRAVTMSLFGMLNWFYMWHRPGKGVTRSDYADLATDLLLGGLAGMNR